METFTVLLIAIILAAIYLYINGKMYLRETYVNGSCGSSATNTYSAM
jgi:hypothetical protein